MVSVAAPLFETQSKGTKVMNTEEKIITLLISTERNGIESLINYLKSEGFFTSPASTKFHGSYQGGLAKHSMTVYEFLRTWCLICKPDEANARGQKPLKIKSENIKIAALLHDVCKVGAYIGSEAPYRWNKAQPKGHATLSIARIKKHIELMEIEEMIIRYHMGVYGLRELYEEGSWEYKTNAEYPLRSDHSKDEKMSKEESQKARYGKSLRNAWYHNPVCKLMYFADEISIFEDMAYIKQKG